MYIIFPVISGMFYKNKNDMMKKNKKTFIKRAYLCNSASNCNHFSQYNTFFYLSVLSS